MKIVEKIVLPDGNLLAGKSVADSILKDGETLVYDGLKEEWRSKKLLAVSDGVYTIGIGTTTNGTVTISNGIITAIQEAT